MTVPHPLILQIVYPIDRGVTLYFIDLFRGIIYEITARMDGARSGNARS